MKRPHPRTQSILTASAFALLTLAGGEHPVKAAALTQGDDAFTKSVQPILKEFCITCHSTEKQKGDLDLERFQSLEQIKRDPAVWEHALEQIRDQEMPPKDKPKPTPEQLQLLTNWMQSTLDAIALSNAGDPGPVVLRRLSNMEYTYSVRDLTGVPNLDPAKEFPVDGAAGEGFTNAGAALVMSPSLFGKYLESAKGVASHAMLTPTGIRFSEGTSSRDWTNQILEEIRSLYAVHSSTGVPVTTQQQGIKMETGASGRLPLDRYLAAVQGTAEPGTLSPKYLATLRAALGPGNPSPLFDNLRAKYAAKNLSAADIAAWQKPLWKLNSIGHLGKVDGPKSWMEPVSPLVASQEVRQKLNPPADGGDLTVYFSAGDAGDGNTEDFAVWENVRLVAPERPDILLRNLPAVLHRLSKRRADISTSVVKCLAAAHEVEISGQRIDLNTLAKKHGIEADLLTDWLNLLGFGSAGESKLGPLLTKKMTGTPDYNFVKGWIGDNALSVLANSSDQTVRIPGTIKPRSIAVHPSPKLAAVIAWKSPVEGRLQITGSIQDIDTACGNGVAWTLQVRRGHNRETLASGTSDAGKPIAFGVHENVRISPGDAVTVVIDPKSGNHTCDATAVDLVIKSEGVEWNVASEVSPDILAGNPHADSHGHKDVWHFFGENPEASSHTAVPKDSLIVLWRESKDSATREEIAHRIQKLLQSDPQSLAPDSSDSKLLTKILAIQGPLLGSGLGNTGPGDAGTYSDYGIAADLFGKHPAGRPVGAELLCVKAPSLVTVKIPSLLAQGAELVATARLHPDSGPDASVQMQVLTTKPALAAGLQTSAADSRVESGAWSSSKTAVAFNAPVIAQEGSRARERFEKEFAEFRRIFPVALCYTKIVPSDEVVTLTLFHREDEPLVRLMLDDAEKAKLDRLWEELHFVSQSALTLVDAFEQIWQFSTQDGPDKPNGDKRLAPLREPIMQGAEAFQKLLVATEPRHIEAAVEFAERAWRRPFTQVEKQALRTLYKNLRSQAMPHTESIRMVLARTLVAPAFLYRGEHPGEGSKATPINAWELATRLSYFLWSGPPDAALLAAAKDGSLLKPEVLVSQSQRMIKDARVRRLATEFGCQWLHIRDVGTLDEKSERHFPTFASIRGALQEEPVLFFMDFFSQNRSVLSLLDADFSFLNGELAAHYGLEPGGAEWRRVDGLRAKGRGGILGFGSALAKQSGASRTSPILRGNWLSEVVLGEKLPRPPKGVPILPEEAPQGLTERQLIEKHSSDPICANCHKRMDPFGFALEGFDAIGRARTKDSAGLLINTATTLSDGTAINGLAGLRDAILSNRSEDFERQFCRKLLGYALGRSVQLSDKPLLNQMLDQLMSNRHEVGHVLELIVTSPQFREVRGRAHDPLAGN
jgi:Protein of unknown function (DUF1592)/Protein of unknown function (DUF1588)/Protein of unknown function (DUF1587)/Protein of unknown function (DUF1585)/Protein of unknown function (DUF1595)/Planctomycete cytochrome C